MSLFFSEVVEMAFAGGVAAALEVAGVGGKRKLRSFYCRMRAEIKRQLAIGYRKRSSGRRRRDNKRQRGSFHYDPFSYALNFDDSSSALLSV